MQLKGQIKWHKLIYQGVKILAVYVYLYRSLHFSSTERPQGDSKGFPYWVKVVVHHLHDSSRDEPKLRYNSGVEPVADDKFVYLCPVGQLPSRFCLLEEFQEWVGPPQKLKISN